jgi:Ca2+-binding RTX toxin-like protein
MPAALAIGGIMGKRVFRAGLSAVVASIAWLGMAGVSPALAATCDGRHATVVGTDHADRLVGTAGNDVISARRGDDRVIGGGGVDLICGGRGSDVIDGGRHGQDLIFGGRGADLIRGHGGDDSLSGGGGSDEIVGGPQSDTLWDGRGSDHLLGGGGDDFVTATADKSPDIYALGDGNNDAVDYEFLTASLTINLGSHVSVGAGRDQLKGVEDIVSGSGNDTITGNGACNTINGGPGDDHLNGRGNPTGCLDWLIGEGGNDTLLGRAGDDKLVGGHGTDTCVGGSGTDIQAGCETVIGVP